MAYIALSRVPGNVYYTGSVASLTISQIASALRVDPGSVSVVGSTVNVNGQAIGTLNEGFPPSSIVNDEIGNRIKRLLETTVGDGATILQLAARRLAAVARYRRGMTRAQFLAVMGNLYDAAIDD